MKDGLKSLEKKNFIQVQHYNLSQYLLLEHCRWYRFKIMSLVIRPFRENTKEKIFFSRWILSPKKGVFNLKYTMIKLLKKYQRIKEEILKSRDEVQNVRVRKCESVNLVGRIWGNTIGWRLKGSIQSVNHWCTTSVVFHSK